MIPRVTAIIPTLGRSPWLSPCLEALRREGGDELEILVVAQGTELAEGTAAHADRVLSLPKNAGFAVANNVAVAEARGDLLATVNDDVVVDEGWLEALVSGLAGRPEIAAVQGTHRLLGEPGTLDGCGLAWNRSWQAVQIGHGRPETEAAGVSEPREIFGVSATAAIYRRQALEMVGAPEIFDPGLISYYEDVELAVRLRTAGFRALWVPGARARHAGSFTGQEIGATRWRLLYANRHLVVARLLGRSFWPRWPRLVVRDLVDLGRAVVQRDVRRAAGIVASAGRIAVHLPRAARFGEASVPLAELRRFRGDGLAS